MINKKMEKKIASKDAIDVRIKGKEIAPGLFELQEFVDNADYCDAATESWIWSIGRHRKTGQILASTDTRFYGGSEDGVESFECIWLR